MTKWFENALINYDIEVVGVTKYSDITYLIKGQRQKVILRIIDESKIELIENIASLCLPYFETIIFNNRKKAVSCYGNQYFYLTEYISERSLSKTYYLKNVIYNIAELHRTTLKYEHIESSYYEKLVISFEENLRLFEKQDIDLFYKLLNNKFPSPTLWTYCLNETCGKLYVEHFARIIKLFKLECMNTNSRRIVLNFAHFDDNCFDTISNKLIGCHKLQYDSPVIDLILFIHRSYNETVLTCIKEYMNSFGLEKEEQILLICMLYNSIKLDFRNDEYSNVYQIIEVSRRIEFIFALEDILGIDFSKLNC